MKQPDPLDNATELAERERESALQDALQNREPAQHVSHGEVLCIDCDDEIPAERLLAKPHAARCIDCQEYFERKKL